MRALQTLAEGIRIAAEAVRANLFRSSLTVLGVAVGVAVVVVVAALLTGVRESVVSGLEAVGPENFIVTRFDVTAVRIGGGGSDRPPWWGKPQLEPEEAAGIARLDGIEEALFAFDFSVEADFEGHSVGGVAVQASSSGWPAYTRGDFVVGRDFTPAEVRQSRAVAVVTAELADELFAGRDPLGRRVGLGSPFRQVREEFTVIGVFHPEENIFTQDNPHMVMMPHTSATKRLRASDWGARILVVPEDTVAQRAAMDEVVTYLRATRGLGPREENSFALLRSDQLVEFFDQLTSVFVLVMLALSSVGLMVGGVGVIGIMLISVTERTREIGIRKAVGATRREILWQFLVEASFLTALGGAAGMAFGALAAEVVERNTPIPAAIPLWSVFAALAMAVVTGMLFGIVPAYRAARLEPVDALRHE